MGNNALNICWFLQQFLGLGKILDGYTFCFGLLCCVESNALNTLLVLITFYGTKKILDGHTFWGSLLCGKLCPEYNITSHLFSDKYGKKNKDLKN